MAEVIAWNSYPKREPWETEIYIQDGEILTFSDEPSLVFIILRASGENGSSRGQGRFIYEIQTKEGEYIGYCSIGGSELPTSLEKAKLWIWKTYRQQVLEKSRKNLSTAV